MLKSIKIGQRPVDFLGTAATNIYYKRIFGADPIVLQNREDFGTAERVDLYFHLAYIMYEQARHVGDREAMMMINEDTYLDWMDQMDFGELQDAIGEIAEVYMGQQRSTSNAKKK